MSGHLALFAGGGTAGHVFPALAVADELTIRGWSTRFTGSADGLEARLVTERGGTFDALPARPLVGRGMLSQLGALVTTGRSALAARRRIRRLGVDVAVGTGGYVSAPAVIGARLAGCPSLLVEPNAEAGVANRWLSRWASGAAVAYSATADRLHCPAWVTGVPVRQEFHAVPERSAPGEAIRVLVLGGSQGAVELNEEVPRALAGLADRFPGLTVLHQAGRGKEEATLAAYAAAGLDASGADAAEDAAGRFRVAGFLPAVVNEVAAADLLISRAGAITTAEICAAGRPSVLVPLALAGGHQINNARHLADAGAAVVVRTGEGSTGSRLEQVLLGLLEDPERVAAMGRAARGLAPPNAAAAIADRVEELAARGRGR
ncbi:MAG: undecaprenyldiphospho-muramoylpentapeptide beta-N-acetylglucosaminyltransferase [Acidobacteriota bacterium]